MAAGAWRGAGEVAKVDTIQGPSDGCPRVALALGQGSAHAGSRLAKPVILATLRTPHRRHRPCRRSDDRARAYWACLGSRKSFARLRPARRVLQWLLPPTPRLTGRDIRYLEFSAPVPFLPETNRLLFRSRHFGGLNSHRRRRRSRGTVCQEEIAERDNDERADDDAK